MIKHGILNSYAYVRFHLYKMYIYLGMHRSMCLFFISYITRVMVLFSVIMSMIIQYGCSSLDTLHTLTEGCHCACVVHMVLILHDNVIDCVSDRKTTPYSANMSYIDFSCIITFQLTFIPPSTSVCLSVFPFARPSVRLAIVSALLYILINGSSFHSVSHWGVAG